MLPQKMPVQRIKIRTTAIVQTTAGGKTRTKKTSSGETIRPAIGSD
jgi:hypothetical protein